MRLTDLRQVVPSWKTKLMSNLLNTKVNHKSPGNIQTRSTHLHGAPLRSSHIHKDYGLWRSCAILYNKVQDSRNELGQPRGRSMDPSYSGAAVMSTEAGAAITSGRNGRRRDKDQFAATAMQTKQQKCLGLHHSTSYAQRARQ